MHQELPQNAEDINDGSAPELQSSQDVIGNQQSVTTQTNPAPIPESTTPQAQGTSEQPQSGSALPISLSGPFPDELRGWNWGAFMLSFIWGIAHNVWFSLLCFVPGIGGIMPIILGIKGSEWAWQHRKFESVEQFRKVQKAWSKWGVILLIVSFIITLAAMGVIITAVKAVMTGSSTNAPDFPSTF